VRIKGADDDDFEPRVDPFLDQSITWRQQDTDAKQLGDAKDIAK